MAFGHLDQAARAFVSAMTSEMIMGPFVIEIPAGDGATLLSTANGMWKVHDDGTTTTVNVGDTGLSFRFPSKR